MNRSDELLREAVHERLFQSVEVQPELEPELEVDAIEFCRTISRRVPGAGLLDGEGDEMQAVIRVGRAHGRDDHDVRGLCKLQLTTQHFPDLSSVRNYPYRATRAMTTTSRLVVSNMLPTLLTLIASLFLLCAALVPVSASPSAVSL